MFKSFVPASAALALALALAACGQAGFAPAGAGLKAAKGLAVRAAGFEPETVLEDFSNDLYAWDFFGPERGHPFYQPVTFSKQKAGGSGALELVAPNCPKMSKGFLIRELDSEESEGSFEYKAGEQDDKPIMKLAARVKVSFKWADNTTATSDTSLSAQTLFIFHTKSGDTSALAYGWSNNLTPGRVIASQLRFDDETIPLRTLVIARGNGLGEQCGEAALAKMQPATVERDFIADVRYAFDKNTPLTDPSANLLDAKDGKDVKDFNPPAGGPNTDIYGLVAIGFGAEVPKGICSHAVLDDVAYAIKKTD
jgi:hypothetical protein